MAEQDESSSDQAAPEQTHGMPALLSFFVPGLGQIVKGEVWKGIGMLLGAIIAGLLIVVLIGFIIYPVIWIYSVYDAYNAQV